MPEFDKIEAEDFIVRVRPYCDDEGMWNGEIDLAIVTQPNNPLSDDDYSQLIHFCKMMASCIPIMEYNEDLRELVHAYVMETLDTEYQVALEDKPRVVGEEGNVVKIDFGTKTEGSA